MWFKDTSAKEIKSYELKKNLSIITPYLTPFSPTQSTVMKNFTLILACALLSLHLRAQTFNHSSFTKLANRPTGQTSTTVYTADLDSDAKADIIVSNYGGESISVFKNTSSPGAIDLTAAATIATSGRTSAVAAADLNGDGKPELIASLEAGAVAIFKNTTDQGNISFADKITLPTGNYAVHIDVADVNADGKPDILVVNNHQNTVSVYINSSSSGNIELNEPLLVPTGSAPQGITTADIDGDGKTDIIATNYFSDGLSIILNTSSSDNVSFAPKVDFATGQNANTVRTGDLDNDGKPEIVVGFGGLDYISVFQNRCSPGNVTMAPAKNFTAGLTTYGVDIADFDGDGKNDIATGNYSENTISVLRNITGTDHSIIFEEEVTYESINTSPYDILAIDLDYDNRIDLVTANFGDGSISIFANRVNASPLIGPTLSYFSPVSGTIGSTVIITGNNFNPNASENHVYFGSIKATVIHASQTSLTVTVPEGATTAIISVTTNNLISYSALHFHVLIPGGGGGVEFDVDFLEHTMDLPSNNPRRIRMVDLDGDNLSDIVFTEQAADEITFHRNISQKGIIKFGPAKSVPIGPDPFDLSVSDFDGDGKQDLAISNLNTGLSGTVSVLRNTSSPGSISFASKVEMPAGDGPTTVASADFNGDGKPDLAVGSGNSGKIFLFTNTSSPGNVSFVPAYEIFNYNRSDHISTGDLNGDGKPDMVVSNSSEKTISVYQNVSSNGTIFFADSLNYPSGNFASHNLLADFDNDGKLDIAGSNYSGATFVILRNISLNGVLAFADTLQYSTGKNPMSISAGDLDGDGKTDIIVPSSEPDKVAIYKNLSGVGNILFSAPSYYSTGYGPTHVACGDLDSDGKADLAIGNHYSKVTIARNTFGEPKVYASGNNPVQGIVEKKEYYDTSVVEYKDQVYVQRHYDVTPTSNPNDATGTITLYFRQQDFDQYNEVPENGSDLPTGPGDSAGIANLRVYQHHGISTTGEPGSYSGEVVTINPDDNKIIWNANTAWWEISFDVSGFSGFFLGGKSDRTSSEPPSNNASFVLFPNPARTSFSMRHPAAEHAYIRIVDMRGVVVKTIRPATNAERTEIIIIGLRTGFYKVIWQNGSVKLDRSLMIE
jgi:hypothetical protein